MIYPVKVMDKHGNLKKEKCLDAKQAVDAYWICKYNKKSNTPIFVLSQAERLAWKRMPSNDPTKTAKGWTYLRPHQKQREAIHKIICQREECGKSAMKTMKRAKFCSVKCQVIASRKIQYARHKQRKMEAKANARLGKVLPKTRLSGD